MGLGSSLIFSTAAGEERCPVCGAAPAAEPLETVPYQRIWDLLATEWGVRFPGDVVRRHSPGSDACLVECGGCGLQFFLPLAGGDEEFYRGLAESPTYYSPEKWEFDWTLRRLSPSMSVLDVGCGRGNFLEKVRPRVRKAVGLEANPSAAADARARGLEVVAGELETFAQPNARAFDAACAFHVVEHLALPVTFLRGLLSCVRVGGSLFLSMPNRLRCGRGALEPLDCPPHHLSRWSPAQLRTLEDLLPVRLEEMALEPVEISVPRERLRERVKRGAKRIPGVGDYIGTWGGRAAVRLVFPRFLHAVYRRWGILERLGYCGLSMVARYTVLREES